MKKLVVAVTGASGSIYAKTFIQQIEKHKEEVECHLVFSENAYTVWEWELKESPHFPGLPLYHHKDYFAPFASGSSGFDGMVIIPASMSTIAKITQGLSTDLITRAADVMLKEEKKLILVFRESPLSEIHLRNLLDLKRMGATIFAAAPPFYHHPETIEELIQPLIDRILDHLALPRSGYQWGKTGKNLSQDH